MEPEPTKVDTMIPEVWVNLVLNKLAPRDDWWAKYVGKYPAIAPPPWYKRRWRQATSKVFNAREKLALTIAPWLERDEWE